MVRKSKWLHGLLSVATATVTSISFLSFGAFADDAHEEDKSDFKLCLSLPGDVSISATDEAILSYTDLGFTLSTSKGDFEGFISGQSGSSFDVIFADVGMTPKELNGAKVTLENYFSARMVEGASWEPTFKSSGTSVLTLKTEDISEDSSYVLVPREDISDELFKFLEETTLDFDPSAKEYSVARRILTQYGLSDESYPAMYSASDTVVQDKDTGVCSVSIMDLDYFDWNDTSDGYILLNRQDYLGREFARQIADLFVYCDGELVCHTYPDSDGICYFTFPIKATDSSYTEFEPAGKITFEFLGFDRSANIRKVTGVTNEDYSFPYPTSAYSELLVLARDFVIEYQDVITDGDADTKPEVIPGISDSIDMNTTNLVFNITSKYGDYITSLASSSNEIYVYGPATQNFIDNNDRMKLSLGADVEWGNFSATDSTASIQVDAGEYTLKSSDSVTVKYDGKLKVKDGQTSKVNLTVSPTYTLEVTSQSDCTDYTINGTKYTTNTVQKYVLDEGTIYTIEDAVSGNVYMAQATKDNPHVKIKLGSSDGVISVVDPDDGSFEDVPNTADGIGITVAVSAVILALIGGSFVVIYAVNKKNERK